MMLALQLLLVAVLYYACAEYEDPHWMHTVYPTVKITTSLRPINYPYHDGSCMYHGLMSLFIKSSHEEA